MLGIAYSADIGGMATLIGTPPNMVFMEMYHELFPNLPKVGFAQWMMMGLPISVTFLFTGWLLMTKVIFRMPKINIFNNTNLIKTGATLDRFTTFSAIRGSFNGMFIQRVIE